MAWWESSQVGVNSSARLFPRVPAHWSLEVLLVRHGHCTKLSFNSSTYLPRSSAFVMVHMPCSDVSAYSLTVSHLVSSSHSLTSRCMAPGPPTHEVALLLAPHVVMAICDI
jgi:hypothetical protein